MSEAPLPKKNFSIKSDKNNTFNIEFYADQASFLNIKINSVNKIPSISYSEKLSLSDITKKNKYFLICENISDVLNILEPIIKISENIKLTEKPNELVLNINIPNPLSPNLIFEIKAQKKDLNLSKEELYEINNKLNNRINILEKTVHEQQKIILSLDERLKKIEEKNLKKNEQSLIHNSKNDDGGKGELTEEKIEEIFNDLEEEFYVSGFIKEDIVKEKIKELNGDIIKLREFSKSVL